jgi:small subunit ribosomal protein S4
MGDPRRLKKKYRTPTNPFEKSRIEEEMKYVGKFGLRNKKEFWKHRWQLSRFRGLARGAKALPEEIQKASIEVLRKSVAKLGLVAEDSDTDDILSLTIDSILERRLQTFVLKLGLAKTIVQARQLVTHNHIAVGGKVINSPSYMVKKAEEKNIKYAVNSAFANHADKIWKGETPAATVQEEKVEEVKEVKEGK